MTVFKYSIVLIVACLFCLPQAWAQNEQQMFWLLNNSIPPCYQREPPVGESFVAALYSLRQLTDNCEQMAIRVTNGTNELDVGFNHYGNLNVAVLLNFAGGGDVFVTKWYDQGPGELHLSQSDNGKQPKIVSMGVVVRLPSGRPMMDFTNDKYMERTLTTSMELNTISVIYRPAGSLTSSSGRRTLVALGNYENCFVAGSAISTLPNGYFGVNVPAGGSWEGAANLELSNTVHLLTATSIIGSAEGYELYEDGNAMKVNNGSNNNQVTSKVSGTPLHVGRNTGGHHSDGFFGEIILVDQLLSTKDMRVMRQDQLFYWLLGEPGMPAVIRSPADLLATVPNAPSGIYNVDWGDGGTPQALWCDLETTFSRPDDGELKGFATALRFDSDKAGGTTTLALNAGRLDIAIEDLAYPMKEGTAQTASIDFRRVVTAGATMLMHRSYNNSAVTQHTFFSEIYEHVRNNPNDIFNPVFDSPNQPPVRIVVGAVVIASETRRDRWFFDNGDEIVFDAIIDPPRQINYRINDGEGQGMWSNGARHGAVYTSNCGEIGDGHGNPRVNWGFYGNDNTQMDYGSATPGGIPVGTHVHTNTEPLNEPQFRYNVMFIYLPAE